MRAVVIGATGATGKVLVRQLLGDDQYVFVEIFVRKPWDIQHPKLICHVVDFDKTDQWQHLIDGNIAFCCMGTTKADAGSKKNQWHVDYDYVVQFAQYCKANGIRTFVLLSSKGANVNSKLFYFFLKGRLEQVIAKMHFYRTIIVRPSSLIRPHSSRFGERLAVKILQSLNRLNLFLSYRPVTVYSVANKMRYEARNTVACGLTIIENDEI